MIKFSYRVDGAVEEKVFDKYYELLRFVAKKRIKDEDFVSMNLHAEDEDSKTIEGLDGLVDEALERADRMEEAEIAMEEMMANFFASSEEDEEDKEEDF